MDKIYIIISILMGMCMSICCICMTLRAFISDMFSVTEKNIVSLEISGLTLLLTGRLYRSQPVYYYVGDCVSN